MSRSKKSVFDSPLTPIEPIEIPVKIVLVEVRQAENLTRRVLARKTRGRQARALVDHARQDLPKRAPRRLRIAQGPAKPDALGHPRQEPHRPDRTPLFENHSLFCRTPQRRKIALVFERDFDRLDLLGPTTRKIQQRPMLDPRPGRALLAIGLSQENLRVEFLSLLRFHPLDIHGGYLQAASMA